MKYFPSFAVFALASSLVACGGDSSSSDAGAPAPAVAVNVAAAANGGVADANYDAGNADLVNDGDTTTSNFWAGNVQNDYVEVEFDKAYTVSAFTVHTSATNNVDTKIQFSTDGVAFTDVNLAAQCSTLAFGANRIACTLTSTLSASHVRVQVVAASSVGTRQIYEIEVMGK